MELSNSKPFEKPRPGQFLGTIIDVVDLKDYPTSFGPKNKVRLVWVLGNIDGTAALDSEGNPFRVIEMLNASMNEKSLLYKRISQIINAAPPLLTTSEQLSELLLGRANVLFLVQTPNPKTQGDFYINIAGSSPLMPGMNPPRTPANFVRQKDKDKAAALDKQRIATQTPPPYVPPTAPAYQPAANAAPAPAAPTANDRRF